MILCFVIFESGLRTSAYELFLELQSWPIRVRNVRHSTRGQKKQILSRARPELKLENYESVQHRLTFSGIKKRTKISFHRHFKIPIIIVIYGFVQLSIAVFTITVRLLVHVLYQWTLIQVGTVGVLTPCCLIMITLTRTITMTMKMTMSEVGCASFAIPLKETTQ